MVRSVRVRLCTLTFHGYARLRTLTPQHSARLCTLGLGDTEGDLLYSHAQVLCRKKNWCWWNFCLRALCAEKALKGLSGNKKKNVHACAPLDGEMAHTYAHLPPDTAHTCTSLTLVCVHASNHGSGEGGRPNQGKKRGRGVSGWGVEGEKTRQHARWNRGRIKTTLMRLTDLRRCWVLSGC